MHTAVASSPPRPQERSRLTGVAEVDIVDRPRSCGRPAPLLERVARVWDVGSLLVRGSGLPEAFCLKAVSSAMQRAVDEVAFAFPLWFPQRIYAIGGSCSSSCDGSLNRPAAVKTAEVFGPRDGGAWEALPPMLDERHLAAAVASGGFVYAIGGHNGIHALSTCERFNATTNAWEGMSSLASVRCAASAAAMGGILYTVGGFDGEHALGSVERLNTALLPGAVWEPAPALCVPRMSAAAMVCVRELFVVGGTDTSQQCAHCSIERLDVLAGTWCLEALPAPAVPRLAAAVALSGAGGCLVTAGGHAAGDVERQPLASVECLRADTAASTPCGQGWMPLGPLCTPRLRAAAVAAAGDVYILGGATSAGEALASVERWSAALAKWEPVPPMAWPRDAPAVAVARF
mmetsp:Transcript_75492/g.190953  ORF Transcript_75492/g.190953 Transcript_75492/m.190953 type:complete len:403 (-) Transcript_75492:90-1298(-)